MAYLDDLLGEDESIRTIAHRHVLFLILHTLLYLLGAIALWVLAVVAWQTAPKFERLIALLLLVLSLVPLTIAVYRFLVWKFEQFVVTNFRILQVEGILNKRTFDSALNKVNDVLMTQSVFGRLFGYGNIEIITGSDIGVNKLDGIADPFSFKRSLLDAKMDIEGFDTPRYAPRPGDDHSRVLAALAELRDSGVITADEYDQRKRRLT
jgi:uncharacterized membrane protein YdbT with pleckstrin-like domain